MAKFQCKKCSFEFEKEKMPKKCPFCGAEKSVVPYKTAQHYLEESEN